MEGLLLYRLRDKNKKLCGFCHKIINNDSKHENNCLVRKNFVDEILDKEFIEHYYIDCDFSAHYIANVVIPEIYNINPICVGVIIKRVEEFGFERKDFSSGANNQNTRELKIGTLMKNYGVDNASKSDIIKEKKIRTTLKHYGVENPFQSKEVKEKISNTLFEKYGVRNSIDLPRKITNKSKLQNIIEGILNELNIDFVAEKRGVFSKYNNDLNKIYSPRPDILIESRKIVIEIYGDLWHANPKVYDDDYEIKLFHGFEKAKDIRVKDKIRKDHIESFGYEVVELWECDIKNRLDVIKRYLKIKF